MTSVNQIAEYLHSVGMDEEAALVIKLDQDRLRFIRANAELAVWDVERSHKLQLLERIKKVAEAVLEEWNEVYWERYAEAHGDPSPRFWEQLRNLRNELREYDNGR